MDSLCEPLDIGGCDTSYGYSPVFGRVDGMLDIMLSASVQRLKLN